MKSIRPQRNSANSRGTDALATRGRTARNRDQLKSDRDAMAAGNPAARLDQFGSRHNADDVKAAQRQHGGPGGRSDLQFRESAQDTQPNRGERNKLPGRRRRKSGSAKD